MLSESISAHLGASGLALRLLKYSSLQTTVMIKSMLEKPHFLAAILGCLFCAPCAHAQPSSIAYSGTIASFTVPATGVYKITVYGAQGGSTFTAGGLGASASGDFALKSGTTVDIVVGGQGGSAPGQIAGGGGGGGSFVFSPDFSILYLAAGGGGGGSAGFTQAGPGLAGTSGGTADAAGGTNGSGGSGAMADVEVGGGAGGAGWLTSGSNSIGGPGVMDPGNGGSSKPTFSGGSGGLSGGFGGGGGSGYVAGGGGGGYSGGGGGFEFDAGAGGGSFVAADAGDPVATSGVRSGNGLVTIDSVGIVNGTFQGTVVVAKGDPAPGVPDAVFSVFDSPAIDAFGDVTFKAFVSGTTPHTTITAANNSGIWVYTSGTGSLVDVTGTSAVGVSAAKLKSLTDPVIDPAGSIAYGATLTGTGVTRVNSLALYLVQSGTLGLYARTGSPAAGQTSGDYSTFPKFATEQSDGLTFLSKLSTKKLGLFGVDTSGTAVTVTRAGDTFTSGSSTLDISSISAFVPSAHEKGQSRTVDTVNGNLAFLLSATNKTTSVVLAAPGTSAFTLHALATTSGTNVPGIAAAEWAAFGTPIVNAIASVGFRATVTGTSRDTAISAAEHTGLWLYTGGIGSLQVRTGVATPGVSGTFAALQDPVLNNNDVLAFIGTLIPKSARSAADVQGIWTVTSGTATPIAQAGGSAPVYSGITLETGTFASFQQIVLPDRGGPIFTATLRGAKAGTTAGLWSAADDGTLYLVAQAGNTIEVHGHAKIIKTISIFKTLPEVGAQSRNFDATSRNVAFLANFTDKTWAVVETLAP